MLKTVCLISVLLLVGLGVNADNLYPACGGRISSAENVKKGDTAVVHEFSTRVEAFSLECLAYEVTSIIGSDGVDHCLIRHQTKYAYKLAIKATYTNDNGGEESRYFDVKDFVGGSIGSLRVNLPKRSKLEVVFTNTGENPKCLLSVRELIELKRHDRIGDSHDLPVLVAANPPTIFADKPGKSSLIFRFSDKRQAAETSRDVVTFIRYEDSCDDTSITPLRYLDYEATIPNDLVLSEDDRSQYSSRAITFYPEDVGEYRLCYRYKEDSTANELGTITVFAGNPSYYTFIEGMDADGRIYVGRPCTIKFFGYSLDTRPDGDSAKLVYEHEDCDDGAPAGGVPKATDLGPADDFGPETVFTTWRFTLRTGGSFKICYFRASGNKWTEVPFITDVGPGGITTTTSVPVPIPTRPGDKTECSTVHIEKRYTTAKFVLTGSSLPSDFTNKLSELLCVPAKMISILFFKKIDGHMTAYISLFCDGNACDSVERYNYIVSIQNKTKELSKFGIEKVGALTDPPVFESLTGKATSLLSTALWCITVLYLVFGIGLVVSSVRPLPLR
ncbi:golgi family/lysosome glycoprotein [Angomonas deanei]|nr:golgi family/lysosome glycoprotein [Angomonas deanei]|eukprot:EPY38585.1 golgi family/lysosome glycoprotein [Angomonas deanei]